MVRDNFKHAKGQRGTTVKERKLLRGHYKLKRDGAIDCVEGGKDGFNRRKLKGPRPDSGSGKA